MRCVYARKRFYNYNVLTITSTFWENICTIPISEDLASQGVVIDELFDFNNDGHKSAYSNKTKPGGDNEGVNAYSITE